MQQFGNPKKGSSHVSFVITDQKSAKSPQLSVEVRKIGSVVAIALQLGRASEQPPLFELHPHFGEGQILQFILDVGKLNVGDYRDF